MKTAIDGAGRVAHNRKTNIWIALIICYLTINFGFSSWLNSLGTYSSYVFEVILILISVSFSIKKLKTSFLINKRIILMSIFSFMAGWLVFKLAGWINIGIPFNIETIETMLLLLVVAPIFEEFIFRFFIWKPLENRRRLNPLIITSILFSYSHLHPIWHLPSLFHNFLYYQTAYTFLLAMACGYSVLKYNSLLGAILIHFMFNAGFYFASVTGIL